MTLTEKKLKESEVRFKALFKSGSVPTYAWQKVGDSLKLIDFNDAAEEITQGNVKNFLGLKASEMYRDRPNILEKLHQCLNEKKNSTHEMNYKMQSSKEEKDLIVKYVYVPPDLVLVHTEDITDRKNAQQELKVSEEKYRKLFNNAPFAIVLFKIEGTILDCNESTKLITGYSKEELLGNNFRNFNFYVDAGSANIEERQSQIYSGKPPKERELLLYRKDGSHFWARTQIEFIHMRDGNYIQAIIHDITEKKKAKQKLIESEEKYRSLFNNMNAGFAYHEVIVDENNKPIDYKYIEVNPAFEKLTGLKTRDIIGKKVTEILPGTEDDPADWIGKFGNVGLTGISLTVENYSEAIDRWYKVSGYSPKKGYFAVTFTDITEQKKLEQKLKVSESKFRTIFEAIPDLYFLMSEDTTILDYRGKQQDLYVTPEAFMGKKIMDILPPYLGEQTLELVKKTILTKQPQSLEYNLTIQGKIHFYEARYFYLSENRVSCFTRDITEKKQKDKVISDLARFPSENPNPVLRVNKEKILYINQAGRKLLNVTEGSKIPTLLEEIIFKAFEDNTTKNFEVEADHAIYLFNIAPIQHEDYANIYGQDITERKKSEIALNTEKKFTEDILNSSIDTIFVFDPETGKAHRWNRGFAEVSGYTNEEISKMKAPDSYYNDKDLKRASAAANEVLNMGRTTVEMSLHTKDGKRIPYEYRATRFESSDGKTLIVAVGRDISDRREAERKLKDSEKKYQQAYNRANFYKDLFAHDINNILQVITSSAELISLQLEDSEKSKDIENVSHIIRKHVKKGAKLVRNVRTLTELETGDQITEPIELISVLKDSIKFIQSAYSEKKVDINIETFTNMFSVQANDLLQEIFDNILINAVKYNENSNIEIQIKITKESNESKNLIKMEFLDNGIGIQDDKKKSLFKEGYRKLKGSKGMGLGLSLVSKILNTFNGKIWVEDRVKGDFTKGSNFILLLPEAN